MKKSKSILQKLSSIIGIICFLLAVLCAVVLYFKIQELGMQHVVSASLLASSFFCAFIGVVFIVIGNSDIPSFKIVAAAPPAPSPASLNEESDNSQQTS
ncbi:MAG: hypothetical protein GQ549_05435 [Gammaproteobacteria bacterium]|nr:hypothetical protein [Gammaproteobacteria bacterium]